MNERLEHLSPAPAKPHTRTRWVLLAVVGVALTGYLQVHGGGPRGEARAAELGASKLTAAYAQAGARGSLSAEALPDVYRAIRAAESDDSAPAIPAAETWPAP
jgi:hypothetical protein